MHTWNTVWRTLVCGALLLVLPGGGCVISIDPLDGMNIEREIEKSGKRVHFIQGIQKTGNKLLDFIAGIGA